jgi:hypothetical protein
MPVLRGEIRMEKVSPAACGATRMAAAAETNSASYVADHYVMPDLTREQIESVRDSRLFMDALIRERICTSFPFASRPSLTTVPPSRSSA